MPELAHRLAVVALLAAGLLTGIPSLFAADSALTLVAHRQFMQGLLGAGVLLAAFVPALRLASIAGALLSNGAFAALVLASRPLPPGLAAYAWAAGLSLLPLLFAGAVFAREAWLQARWDGVLPLRQRSVIPEA